MYTIKFKLGNVLDFKEFTILIKYCKEALGFRCKCINGYIIMQAGGLSCTAIELVKVALAELESNSYKGSIDFNLNLR